MTSPALVSKMRVRLRLRARPTAQALAKAPEGWKVESLSNMNTQPWRSRC